MARVIRPLQSGDASGQVGKSVVHFRWKGIHCVRSYVIPNDPNTAAQQAVRADFKACIDAWHLAAMSGLDRDAWKRWVEKLRKAMTNLNAYVSERMKVESTGNNWLNLITFNVNDQAFDSFEVWINGPTGKTVKMDYGTSLTYRPNTVAVPEDGATGTYKIVPLVLTQGIYYYLNFYTDNAPDKGLTGIYKIKTA